MVGPGGEAQANLVNGLRVKQLQKAPLNANGFLSRCQNWSVELWAVFKRSPEREWRAYVERVVMKLG